MPDRSILIRLTDAPDGGVEAVRLLTAAGIAAEAVGDDPNWPAPASDVAAPIRLPSTPAETLSEREEGVLRLLALGHSNKEIAVRLSLSVKTVETYKARGLEKLGFRSRVDLIRHAVKYDWLTEGEDEPRPFSPAPEPLPRNSSH